MLVRTFQVQVCRVVQVLVLLCASCPTAATVEPPVSEVTKSSLHIAMNHTHMFFPWNSRHKTAQSGAFPVWLWLHMQAELQQGFLISCLHGKIRLSDNDDAAAGVSLQSSALWLWK